MGGVSLVSRLTTVAPGADHRVVVDLVVLPADVTTT
jgi:hypothetical protein